MAVLIDIICRCGYCQRLAPDWRQAASKLRHLGINVVAVNAADQAVRHRLKYSMHIRELHVLISSLPCFVFAILIRAKLSGLCCRTPPWHNATASADIRPSKYSSGVKFPITRSRPQILRDLFLRILCSDRRGRAPATLAPLSARQRNFCRLWRLSAALPSSSPSGRSILLVSSSASLMAIHSAGVNVYARRRDGMRGREMAAGHALK